MYLTWLMAYLVVAMAVLGGADAARSSRARHGWSRGYSAGANRKTWSTSPARSGRARLAQLAGRRSRQGTSPVQQSSSVPKYTSMVDLLDTKKTSGTSPARQRGGSMMTAKPSKGYSNYAARCGSCKDASGSPVCGSDGKTYPNQCELDNVSCRKYWDITVVSQGACQADCPGVEDFGFYTGFGLSRASNKGYCIHDFFRCCRTARKIIGNKQAQTCCQGRFDKCHTFVAAKPWRAGVKKYGR